MKLFKLYTDGGSRGNPGPSAAAYVICKMDGTVVEKSGDYLGLATNNQAEYRALLAGLQRLSQLGSDEALVYMDSELVVKQLSGLYKVKNGELIPFYNQAKVLAANFKKISFNHIPREQNAAADREVNRILDLQEKA